MATHSILLTDKQLDTVLASLRLDYKETKAALGALPVGLEMCEDIKDAYTTIMSQIGERQET